MPENRDNLTGDEKALAELERLERAGVFRPTPVDLQAVLDTGRDPRTPWIYKHRVSVVAASVVLAAGVWVTMFATQLGDLHRAKLAQDSRSTGALAAATIQSCVAGPQRSLSRACKSFDTDTDGDVDLADIRSFQIAYNR